MGFLRVSFLDHIHQLLPHRRHPVPNFVSSLLQGTSERCGSHCAFRRMLVPYLAAIFFRPSYSDLEMETSELVRISSRFLEVD